jgi:hypothetical protein
MTIARVNTTLSRQLRFAVSLRRGTSRLPEALAVVDTMLHR